MKIRSRFWVLGAAALLTVAACDDDDPTGPEPVRNFTATLSGLNERPNPVSPAGTGSATFQLDAAETTLTYSITVGSLTSAVTGAHIHLGNAQVSGGIIVPLTNPVNGQTVNGSVSSTTTLGLGLSWSSLIDLMRNGDTYVNVHTSNNPGGETRGQLIGAP